MSRLSLFTLRTPANPSARAGECWGDFARVAKKTRRVSRHWRTAERYFQRYRDPEMKVSLPRVSCLEAADD